MLLLTFTIESDTYAIDARSIDQVIPVLPLRRVPGTDLAVAGILNYRGSSVPVVDLTQLYSGKPAPRKLSTRILITPYLKGGQQHQLGLLVTAATDTLTIDPSTQLQSNIRAPSHMGLGDVVLHEGHWIQLVQPQQLLTDVLHDNLFVDQQA